MGGETGLAGLGGEYLIRNIITYRRAEVCVKPNTLYEKSFVASPAVQA